MSNTSKAILSLPARPELARQVRSYRALEVEHRLEDEQRQPDENLGRHASQQIVQAELFAEGGWKAPCG